MEERKVYRRQGKQLILSIGDKIHARLFALADYESRSVSELVREAIGNLLRRREIKKKHLPKKGVNK